MKWEKACLHFAPSKASQSNEIANLTSVGTAEIDISMFLERAHSTSGKRYATTYARSITFRKKTFDERAQCQLQFVRSKDGNTFHSWKTIFLRSRCDDESSTSCAPELTRLMCSEKLDRQKRENVAISSSQCNSEFRISHRDSACLAFITHELASTAINRDKFLRN